ncbi:protein involved in gliding motility SprA [Flavobacterium sp. 90]|uniref:T9SS outer membrane translocon Sov/SprA n=1 Tax=unclassified Flavobacterium TaxID=196869 RepID=UPI000EB169B1|nr:MULTISPECIES: cell surface protein SprA [unclassified Flavobacterium]RKR09500.1 protein involved in gliding motility SprA [Flavobacterium sp. 81]TCK53284.1 protein involved in gliding motility SprA [Flavobacterium sp. 90]
MRKICIFLLVLFCGNVLRAQVNPAVKDTTKTQFSVGKVEIEDPPSILSAYRYDPITDRYIYTSSVDGFSINYPIVLTPKEYEDLVLKESRRDYFKKKSDAIDGKKAGSEANKKNLLPRYYINSSLFESVFGSNTIDVKPTGSVEMDLGIRYTKQDNPSFSPRNRSSLTFDFDQRISMSLMGKVGTRLDVNANYDTQSTFAFQNLFKLAYSPSEDDIIQKVEVGNVSMPLNSTLIRGAQSLFGVKTQLQFGKTTITGVFSEQKSQTKSIVAEGGGTVQNFDLYALDYDNDRHFFLSQYFRNKYDASLKGYPFIDSRVQVTRIEVWVTNKQNRVSTTSNNLRNVIALQDLGEAQATGIPDNQVVVVSPTTGFFSNPVDSPAENDNNKYDPAAIGQSGSFLNSNIREIVTAKSGFNSANVSEGTDYSILENARKLNANEFTFNAQLGYISLQQRLANDEILAVAYEYTIGGKVYQVGEFGSDGVDGTIVTGNTPSNQAIITQSLILKMLKSSLTNVQNPVWNLMMKNVYQIPQAYQIKQDDFRLNILYTDPSPINYITPVQGSTFPPNPAPDNKVDQTPLLNVFNLDRLNYNNDPQTGGDGFFDYLPGITVDVQNGRIIFTTKEPFGKLLFDKLNTGSGENYNDPSTYNPNQKKYVFNNMYRNTQSGALQDSDKNKFLLRGKYKSSGSNGIPIGAFNVPQGSVVVMAAGRRLVEGIDYSVDYQLGRVQILDPSLQASNTPIEVSLENNSIFGQQTRRFMGFNIEHKISDNFIVGGTFLKMTERPFTQKSSYGQESVNNTIFGFNGTYSTEVPFFTRLVNKLPNIDTDVPSNLSIRGEVAFLRPDAPKASDFEGEATIYVDDFEGSQSTIDMRSAYAWSLASTPFINTAGDPTFNANFDDLRYGYKRAKLAWYTIDPIFYTSKPSGISNDDLSLNTTRRIYSRELYPNTDIAQGQIQVINTLDLSYYPSDRGPYNNNPNFSTDPASSNFGGIMRALNSTNFEQGNVEYIQFWVLDPYVGNGEAQTNNTGKIYFNLGEVSEDVLKDGRKQYENGLGPGQIMVNPQPIWGDVPASQSLIYAFDTNPDNRRNQDVGLDGLPDAREGSVYTNYAGDEDPAADNYTYYLNTTGGVLDRYKKYNGVENNSAVSIDDPNRGSTTLPDVEDINRDNTMSTINAYYEYSIDIKPGMQVGQNYITDIRDVSNIELPNGGTTNARWIQFKIPVSQPQKTIGNITDFRSIRFMRMFMTGFSNQMTMRFGALDLVRGEWRRYTGTLDANDTDPTNDGTEFDVSAVNIQENSTKCPVNYVIPPGVQREQLYNNNTIINQNEQALALRVGGSGLQPMDSRAVFKNVSVDMRQYKKLKMFLHAESLPSEATLQDDEMVGFIRFGNDFTQNFYQVEIPLKVTRTGGSCTISPDQVWMEENNIDLALELLTSMKIKAMSLDPASPKRDINGIYYPDNDPDSPGGDGDSRLVLGIKGNPNFGLVRNLMVGVKSRVDHKDIKGEVWFNELRLADLENKGGMAAILNIDTNMADFATVSATGKKSTIGFGSLEQGANERSREDIQQYNIVTNLNLGQLLPHKWGINLPFNYAIGEEVITPEYDPFNQDIKLDQLIRETTDQAEKDNIRTRAVDYTKRRSINFIGVKKDRAPEQKPHIYDVENLTFSQSYNEVNRHDYEVETYQDQQSNTAVNYAYTFQPKEVVPFKTTKFMKTSEYWKILSDFNFNYLPSNITFNTNILRQSNRQQFRDVETQGIPVSPLFRRNFAFNYQYGFGYNLTKSLKLNYTAASNNIVKNFLNDDNTPKQDFNIWDDYLDIGTPNSHIQQLVLNYEIPINKIPVFSFVKASYSYTADYNWQRSSSAFADLPIENPDGSITNYNLGNTIQNANSNTLTTTFNMNMLYKYLGLTPGAKSSKAGAKPKAAAPPKPGEKIVNTAKPVVSNSPFYDGLIGILTSVKNIQVNYTKNSGTVLPGYTPSVGFFGTSRPTLGFVFGSQDDVRYEAAKNGWLTDYQDFNQNFTQVTNKLLKITANIDLLPDLKIDLAMDRAYSQNTSEQYSVDPVSREYLPLSPYTYGMFSISTVLIKTAFSKSDETQSAAFDDFRNNRLIIANRLAEERYGSAPIPRYDVADVPPPPVDPTQEDPFKKQREIYASNQGYPIGYGKSNQAVLLPSFLAAYTGSNASNVSTGIFRDFPIPNWSIKYNGLMRYKFFKDKFKRFSLQNNYRASYTINQFRSNFDYSENPNGQDVNTNFFNKTIMSNVNLVEQFSPLIRVDFELKSSLRILTEIKKDRALSMSFDNNLLTEVRGMEYVVGMGYRFKDVIFSSRLADSPTGIIKSDINIKADFSFRNNQTLVRYLDYDNNQLAAGQNIWSLKMTADYAFSKNLTAIFYYDHSFSKAVISTSFPLTNIRSGFTLRYNFGN